MRKKYLFFVGILLFMILILSLSRTFPPKEIDDVSPGIFCEEEYLEKAEIFWVIPEFENNSIAENQVWCEEISSLNKTLGMHGVMHEYNEFEKDKNQKYIEEGIKIFEACFNKTPTMFKPPQLKISLENKNLIKKNKMELKGKLNQIFHKVYHCNNAGEFPNWFIDLF